MAKYGQSRTASAVICLRQIGRLINAPTGILLHKNIICYNKMQKYKEETHGDYVLDFLSKYAPNTNYSIVMLHLINHALCFYHNSVRFKMYI